MINQSIPRYTKAFELVAAGNVVLLKHGYAVVHSMDGKNMYHVNYLDETCECPDHQFRQIRCAHILATLIKSGNMTIVKEVIWK